MLKIFYPLSQANLYTYTSGRPNSFTSLPSSTRKKVFFLLQSWCYMEMMDFKRVILAFVQELKAWNRWTGKNSYFLYSSYVSNSLLLSAAAVTWERGRGEWEIYIGEERRDIRFKWRKMTKMASGGSSRQQCFLCNIPRLV